MTTTAVAPTNIVRTSRRYRPGTWRVPVRTGGTGEPGPVLRVVVVSGEFTPVTPTAVPR